VNSRRPFNPGILSNIQMIEPSATSNYHGLQLNVDKRMAQGFSFKGFYTFSKTIGLGGLEAGNMPGSAQNHTKLFLDRGRSSADRTHNFVLSGIWEINYVQDGPALARWLANGWQLSSILSLRSGQPFSVTTGRDNNLDGANFDRANLAGDPHLSANRPRQEVLAAWFNTAAFNSLAGGGEDGTSGVNILDGPGLRNVDLGIFRNFRIREGIQMQFRTEMTNAFNLVSLGGPITAMNNAAFGTIRTAGQMRQIQFGLRLAF
jgi:hypothetical protein